LLFLLAMLSPAAHSLLPAGPAVGPLALATALTAGIAIVLVACAVHAQLDPTAAPARTRTIALRQRARRAEFLRLRDPDAPGRTRPRAPSASPAAA
jgi:hypothetical protein